ncbi:2-succinyl-6-hydroxy-2,4-cyclohexadiene-1-carboxylate synthase [Jeotgalibacillus sp. ET6]|uniref:2-succinyl-6-hydroxy-2, 4-cyclohexadiene-1-carboxylate synthase n=1 Tax=Jeotgalibacillus sp. ET6 TaxID=3037260 RepID=UPI002418851B|nr:2-succinyl-6-hydroxy-2,4-cyclohexadiene-1-carboxylate synthase [Jeotgalibacillus sp. ET6]MDG5473570.1 2-succinyl-6-hydroxy-2,4-cyclohexadiene-1-carboxylate synthase [Jeotgalibacillus sp. ET6]
MEVMIRGAVYHIDVKGEGRPVLFLHGFTGDSSAWGSIIHKLSQSVMCIAIDLPGHGKTVMPRNDLSRFSMKEVCRDLGFILEYLNVKSADVLGYSMGGRTALSFAAFYPDKVRKLILESASPGLESIVESEARKKQDDQLAQFILNEGIAAFVDRWENIPLFETQKNLDAEVQENLHAKRMQNKPEHLAASLQGMGTGRQPSWWGELNKIKHETLLITGEKDRKFCQIAKNMADQMPNAKKVEIPETGHAIHVEQPEKFGTIIEEFLESD